MLHHAGSQATCSILTCFFMTGLDGKICYHPATQSEAESWDMTPSAPGHFQVSRCQYIRFRSHVATTSPEADTTLKHPACFPAGILQSGCGDWIGLWLSISMYLFYSVLNKYVSSQSNFEEKQNNGAPYHLFLSRFFSFSPSQSRN